MMNVVRIFGFLGIGLFVFAMAPGCSSDGGTSTASGDDTKFCQDLDARDAKCHPGDIPQAEKCKTEWASERKAMRADLVAPLQQCLVQRECGVSDDSCYASTGKTAPASSARDSYEGACLAKVKECTKAVVSDDLCTDGDVPWRLWTDDVYTRLGACFSKPCADVKSCLTAENKAIRGQ